MYTQVHAHPQAVVAFTLPNAGSRWLEFSGKDEGTNIAIRLDNLPPKVADALYAAAQAED